MLAPELQRCLRDNFIGLGQGQWRRNDGCSEKRNRVCRRICETGYGGYGRSFLLLLAVCAPTVVPLSVCLTSGTGLPPGSWHLFTAGTSNEGEI
jgi:hypothetical protein